MSLRAVRARNIDIQSTQRHAVVIGGTSGIGKGIALRLAKAGNHVTIAGRNKEVGEQIVSQMKQLSPEAKFKFVEFDASLLANAKSFTAAIQPDLGGQPLDYLVLSAGIASMDAYKPTSEGIDQKLAIHCLSRASITQSFLPLMKQSADPRVLSVFSAGVHGPYANYESDFDLSQTFSLKNCADATGMYNDIAAESFSLENPNVSFIHQAPGFVDTNWGTELNWFMRGMVRAIQVFAKSSDDCAEFMTNSLWEPKYKSPGFYLLDQYAQPANKTALHDAARESVWKNIKSYVDKYLA